MLSGKKGVVSIHMGDSHRHMQLLQRIIESTDIPITQFYPTHVNRSKSLLNASKKWLKQGGYVDLTTSTTEMDLANGEPRCCEALAELLEEGYNVEQISFSSDGHASLPTFDDDGNLAGLKVGSEQSLFVEVREAIQKFNIPLETAIKVITSTSANILGLDNKGVIKCAADADMVLLESGTLAINSVLGKGKLLVEDGKPSVKGTFQ